MRKLVIVAVLGLVGVAALAQSWDNVIALDTVAYGWTIKNESGQIVGVKGFSLMIGWGEKYYFEPLQEKKFNTYWGWAVGLSILGGYALFGGDYLIQDGIYVGGAIGAGFTLYGLMASMLAGMYGIPSWFSWPVFPVVGVTVGVYF